MVARTGPPGEEPAVPLSRCLVTIRRLGVPSCSIRGLWIFLWDIVSRRHGSRLPTKIKDLEAKLKVGPWGALIALAKWIERREPELAARVALALHGTTCLDPAQSAVREWAERGLRGAVKSLQAQSWGRGKLKVSADSDRVGECYEWAYEKLPEFLKRAKVEKWDAAPRPQAIARWASALRPAYQYFGGHDREPSDHVLGLCWRWTSTRPPRHELALHITADCFALSPETLKNWKHRKKLPPDLFPRRRPGKPRQPPSALPSPKPLPAD